MPLKFFIKNGRSNRKRILLLQQSIENFFLLNILEVVKTLIRMRCIRFEAPIYFRKPDYRFYLFSFSSINPKFFEWFFDPRRSTDFLS